MYSRVIVMYGLVNRLIIFGLIISRVFMVIIILCDMIRLMLN